jgi:PAS domain S-box-containing protein
MENKYPKANIFKDLPLGWKFSFMVSVVVLTMGIISIIFIESRVSNTLHAGHQDRGVTIARNLAANCIDLVLTENRLKLHQLLLDIKVTEKHIEYLFVLDARKRVFAHTFGEKGFPKVLLDINPIQKGKQAADLHLQFDNSKMTIHDLAVLAMNGEAGEVHVGLSQAFIQQKVQELRMELVGITSLVCLLGIFAAFFFTRIINKPLKSLAIASDKFGQGKLSYELPITGHDEIGRLTVTFNQMVANIGKAKAEQKEAEEDRMRLAAAIDQASEAVVITDVEGNIQYVNPAFVKLTGYSREEAIGQNPRILKSGTQDQAFYEKMWKTILQGGVWRDHLVSRKKDGSLFSEEVTISPVKNNEGQISNFVAVKRDVSKEVSLERQLRQAMKMEAIGTLTGGIAHDFNNILTAILGYTEIAKVQLPADAQVRKDLDQVMMAGKRATDLVKQLLTFSRQGEEDYQVLKIQLIIKEVLKLLRSSLPTTIQLKEDIVETTGPVLADPTQIHQVLMNLCTNAKHAIGAEMGTLSVSLSEIQVTDSSLIVDCPQIAHGHYLDLAISDTGSGMDELTRSKIFDPFFTTKEKGKGTGLGLAVVHGIIKQHKGEITVSSRLGQGTTFHIYLPISREEESAEQLLSTEIMPQGSERILLVDDETMIVQVLQRILNDLGYTVSVFTSSVEALEAYTKKPDDYDLLITDMTMPEMTGTDLAGKVLAIRPDLPVILCTGYNETMDAEKAALLGINEYIMKPVDNLTLANTIRKALESS